MMQVHHPPCDATSSLMSKSTSHACGSGLTVKRCIKKIAVKILTFQIRLAMP